MRKACALVLLVAGSLASTATAQNVRQDVRTPAEIAAALSAGGKAGAVAPGADEDDGSIAVGDERAFSLACTGACGGGARANQTTPRSGFVRPTTAAAPGRGMAHRRAASARPRGGVARAALDMQLTFATGSAELDAEARRRIDPFAVALTQSGYGLAANSFRVEGHTDSVGNRDSNLDLSRRRAQSVVDYLVAKGVPASRLAGKGFGPDAPLPGVSGSSGANRRVEIIRN